MVIPDGAPRLCRQSAMAEPEQEWRLFSWGWIYSPCPTFRHVPDLPAEKPPTGPASSNGVALPPLQTRPGWSLPPMEATGSPPPWTRYCLDISGASRDAGAPAILWECNNDPTSFSRTQPIGSGFMSGLYFTRGRILLLHVFALPVAAGNRE